MSTAVAPPEHTTPAVLEREAPTRARTERDPWMDNAKYVLVTLVVVGHAWTVAASVSYLYSWLYLWHVPAFVMVTGYLSRTFRFTPRHLHRLAVTVVFPYVLFEGLFALLRTYVGGEELEALWLNPHWPMWYLSVLFLWRLATPLLQRVPYVLPLSFAVSLGAGFLSLTYLDGNRTLGLLPFFVLGLVAQPHHLDLLRTRTARRVGLGVLAAGVAAAWFVEARLDSEWLYYRTPYAELVDWAPQGIAVRAFLLAVGAAMALSALAWVPRDRTWFTRLGAASLVVYLFHGFVVEGATIAGMKDWSEAHAWQSVLITTVGGVLLSTALAWPVVARQLNKVVTPPPIRP